MWKGLFSRTMLNEASSDLAWSGKHAVGDAFVVVWRGVVRLVGRVFVPNRSALLCTRLPASACLFGWFVRLCCPVGGVCAGVL